MRQCGIVASEQMPATSKRPPRAKLLQVIKETGGRVSEIAARFDCSRPTVYKWLYQLDLARVVGVATVDGVDASKRVDRVAILDAIDALYVPDEKHTSKYVKLPAVDAPILGGVSTETIPVRRAAEPVERKPRTMSFRSDLWRGAAVKAAAEDKDVRDVIEEAVERYLEDERARRGGEL